MLAKRFASSGSCFTMSPPEKTASTARGRGVSGGASEEDGAAASYTAHTRHIPSPGHALYIHMFCTSSQLSTTSETTESLVIQRVT